MDTEVLSPPLARIKLVMERSFEEFDSAQREEFLEDLAQISGCPRSEFQEIRFYRGCVLFEGKLDHAAVARLLELYEKRNGENGDEDTEEFKAFLEKYAISQVSDPSEFRIQIVKLPSQTSRKIVFVHGWSGETNSFGKLPDFLSDKFACECAIYNYTTGPRSHSPSITFIARNLDNWLRNHANAETLAFIAHSMGGIVTRKMIVSQFRRKDPLDCKVKQITFVASPHQGATLAAVAKKIPGFGSDQLSELDPGSSFLIDLNDHWSYWIRENVPETCQIRCIYGTADNIVSANNAAGPDPDAVPILGADHSSIVKPARPDDEIVLTIERFLHEAKFDL